MKQVYISCSFPLKQKLEEAIDAIKKEVKRIWYNPFDTTQEREMI